MSKTIGMHALRITSSGLSPDGKTHWFHFVDDWKKTMSDKELEKLVARFLRAAEAQDAGWLDDNQISRNFREAAAAITQLRGDVARVTIERDSGASWLAQLVIDKWNGTDDLPAWVRESADAYMWLQRRAERAEAEVAAINAEQMESSDPRYWYIRAARAEAELAATLAHLPAPDPEPCCCKWDTCKEGCAALVRTLRERLAATRASGAEDAEWALGKLCDGDAIALINIPRAVLREVKRERDALAAQNAALTERVQKAERDALHVAGERMGDDAYIESLTLDAERYRFLRSPLAAEGGPVQRELWEEMGVKLCREEAMDREVDTAMRLLRAAIARESRAEDAK